MKKNVTILEWNKQKWEYKNYLMYKDGPLKTNGPGTVPTWTRILKTFWTNTE